MKKLKYILFTALSLLFFSSCEDYLDQDPEQLNTLEKVFSTRTETIKWYNGLYKYGSENADHWYIQDVHNANQIPYFWCDDDAINLLNGSFTNILKGQTSPDYPYPAGKNIFTMYYKGIRHANIFLENIDKNTEMGEGEKKRYIAETRFMRAMFHYWLLRLYGPIPIAETSVAAGGNTKDFKRNSLDECVNWIVQEFDFAMNNGMVESLNPTEWGFPTVGAAQAMKAKLFIMVASPLYNGNSQFANWKNKDGQALLYTTYDAERWKKAADAALVVISSNKYKLQKAETNDFMDIVDNYRSITTTWNDELIWANPNTTQWYSRDCMPGAWYGWSGRNSVTLDLVNFYRMADGSKAKPVDEWFANKQFSSEDGNGTKKNTFWMFVDREARFYASMHFPNQYLSYAYPTTEENKKWKYVDFWYEGESGNKNNTGDKNSSGFSVRKNIPMDMMTDKVTSQDTWQLKIPFPHVRLGDIYLIYSEAMNEYYGEAKQAEVLKYLNEVRTRSGLPALKGSYSKEEMREIIREERRIEMAYEANRYFDVRRWFIAHGPEGVMNQPVYGLDMTRGAHATDPSFFTKTWLQDRSFSLQHYFLPIPAGEVMMNELLVQAPFY